uniref:Ovule protein n=1 Tax=Mesocestoides corti TaxID=53468 RepID=A0A5K3F788_MESCO
MKSRKCVSRCPCSQALKFGHNMSIRLVQVNAIVQGPKMHPAIRITTGRICRHLTVFQKAQHQ